VRQNQSLITVLMILLLTTTCFFPFVEGKVTVHSLTVTTDKSTYTIGSEAIAKAVLDFTGSKKDLLGVNFTWHYPNGTIAKFDPNVMPDGTGTAYSSWWPDEVDMNFIVNATYTGDETKFDDTSFDVVDALTYTKVSGPISSDVTWSLTNSPYIVIGDVFVENDVTLTIEPGVVVEFKNGTALMINGTIIAIGNKTYMITFTSNNSNPQPGDWRGIEFNYAEETSEISYARIEYADDGIYIFDSSPKITYNLIRDLTGDGIKAYKSSSYIAYNTITEIAWMYTGNKGINLQGDCDVTLLRNVISNVEEYGIKIMYSNPTVLENIISGGIFGIECSNSYAEILNNSIMGAASGIRIVDCTDSKIMNNTISYNERKGIRCEESSLRIQDNQIEYNGEGGLDDSGIWLYNSRDVEVVNNILKGNTNGLYIKNTNATFVFKNLITNSFYNGLYADDSSNLEAAENIIDNSQNGFYLRDSTDITLSQNIIENNTEKALFSYNSLNITIEKDTFITNKNGIHLQSSILTLANSTISGCFEKDVYLVQNSQMISINSTFSDDKVLVSGDCELIIKNYLHIFIQNFTFQPFEGVRVDITDNNVLVYSNQTDEKGMCRFLLLTDRIFMCSSTPTENITLVKVQNGSVILLDNPREVDMYSSHLEIFSPGNPLSLEITSPANNSLIFNILNITGTSSSYGEKINSVNLRMDDGDWFSAKQIQDDWSFWFYELDTKILSDGHHKISARVSTPYHQKEIFIRVMVDNIGNKPPMIWITSHNSNETVNGTIKLEGRTFDYDGVIVSVDISIDYGSWISVNETDQDWLNWSFSINTTDYHNGMHNITFMAVDNSSESMLFNIILIFDNVDKDNGNDNGNGGEGDEDDGETEELGDTVLSILWLILIVALVAIIVLLIYLALKRKEKEEE